LASYRRLQRHSKSPGVKKLSSALVERCASSKVKQKLAAMLAPSAEPVGLILSERMVNMPVQLIPDVIDSLAKDLAWAAENEEDPTERRSFRFSRLLLVAELHAAPDAAASEAGPAAAGESSGRASSAASSTGPRPSKRQKKQKGGDNPLDGLDFVRVEEEILSNEAEMTSLLTGAGRSRYLLSVLEPATLASVVPALRTVMCD